MPARMAFQTASLLLSFQTCPHMVSRETSIRRESRHHLADLHLVRTLSTQSCQTLRESRVTGWKTIGESETTQEHILDCPRTDATDIPQQTRRMPRREIPQRRNR